MAARGPSSPRVCISECTSSNREQRDLRLVWRFHVEELRESSMREAVALPAGRTNLRLRCGAHGRRGCQEGTPDGTLLAVRGLLQNADDGTDPEWRPGGGQGCAPRATSRRADRAGDSIVNGCNGDNPRQMRKAPVPGAFLFQENLFGDRAKLATGGECSRA